MLSLSHLLLLGCLHGSPHGNLKASPRKKKNKVLGLLLDSVRPAEGDVLYLSRIHTIN